MDFKNLHIESTAMPLPDRIPHLIETFQANLEIYQKGPYNETQLRREYIDPFFEALGWDVSNRQGYAEAYKDVIHEDAIKIGGVTKAPDYCFRIGGVRKFFLEAKKPAANIREARHPAYQLRRYGWSAKLPLSILTNFTEFAVYDCRVRPHPNDKASHSRILYFSHTDYVHKWDELARIFAREAILKGAFDKYVVSTKAKKGTTEVDMAFLQEIERWRELLARNLALRNPTLTSRELNYAVQQTIDRIVFLRICEDRGIEDYGRLMALQNGNQVYARLIKLFQEADNKYNSGLFHFHPETDRPHCDRLTPGLILDDKVLKDIFKNLYYPESPYEFSVLSVDILGQVYERFLGRVIRLTAGNQAKVEEKPEVRKAGGVYYTPTYIVDYIVRHTVGPRLAGQKIRLRQTPSLTILDPACGSGSFLLGAYQFLLDWYHRAYLADDPSKYAKGKTPSLYQAHTGDWRLTTEARKRILLSHIYGVDIDPQAVEVTKLSLLLKVLEGEDEQSMGRQLVLFQERVLPDLSRNIKCGNSLIGPDFYTHVQMDLLDETEMYRVNVFDWSAEFAGIMGQGGFDVVIGNPPYVRQEGLKEAKSYFQQMYAVYHGTADLYTYFIEKGISLLKPDGYFGYIVANKWLRANYGKPLRQWLKTRHLVEFIDFGDLPVFQQATTYPCILVVRRTEPAESFKMTPVHTLDYVDLDSYVQNHCYDVQQSRLEESGWALVKADVQNLLDKLNQTGVPLGDYVQGRIYRGVLTGLNEAFVIDAATRERLMAEDARSEALIKPFLLGKEIKRYQPPQNSNYLILMPKGWTNAHRGSAGNAWKWLNETYPAIATHLNGYAAKAQKRCDKGEYWWELRACDYYNAFEKPKIIIPAIVQKASYAFDIQGHYSNDKTSIIALDDMYLLGLLNSRLLDFIVHSTASTKQGGYYEYKPMYVGKLPIRAIDATSATDQSAHTQMTTLVTQMLDLNQKLSTARDPQTHTLLQRQIEATDRQIDQLVYQLYDLTAQEIELVEAAG